MPLFVNEMKSRIALLVVLVITIMCNSALSQKLVTKRKCIDLAGQWNFKLDPQGVGQASEWFTLDLTDQILLPGSCEQRGYGIKTTKPSEGRLTRSIKYEGKAWYQKEINVPASWKKKRIELFLERCHWESNVWVDDKPVGMLNSLCTPHIHDLGILKPGKHRLSICIDNTYKIPIGTWGHSITEDTQGNWNGIIGRLELIATDPVWIKNVQVFSTVLKVSIGNQTGKSVKAKIESQDTIIPSGGCTIELPFTRKEKPWDEFVPTMRSISINLKTDKWNDTKIVSYGTRDIRIKNQQFNLNDRPVYLRGTVDECVYPLTGYPPMDKKSWVRVLKICQSYGLNFMRFHSWCPPEAAFEAGDDLGFFFQVELPLWTMDTPPFGQHPVRDNFVRDELTLILDAYGNHPSFVFMAMGNESSGTLDELTRLGRAKDARHFYRCEKGNTEETGDYFETGQRGILGPRTDWDRRSFSSGWIAKWNGSDEGDKHSDNVLVPTMAHEVGQWCMYPDFDEIKKYTGTLRPFNFEGYKKSLEAHHMLDQAKSFAQASGKFSVLLYKDEIEASLRTYPYGGIQILDARDYPGQGTAIVGWLDAFWDSKNLILPTEFRRFCAPTVCLMRIPKRTFTTNEPFVANAEIAHYGPNAIEIYPEWTISDSKGFIIANGTLPGRKIETGCNTQLGIINASLSKVKTPEKLIVTLSAAGTSNSWEIWAYPEMQTEIPKNVNVAHAFDKAAKDALGRGENVLLLSSPTEGIIDFHPGMLLPDSVRFLPKAKPGRNAIQGSFMPVFWCTRLFNQIGTTGIFCNPKHPAFATFPTEEYSNWQWADLIGNFSAANSFRVAGATEDVILNMKKSSNDVTNRSKAILLDEMPPEFRPILQIIDNYDRNSKLGTIFEARVGKGKLLVCAMDLETDSVNRLAAKQLMRSLLNYVSGCQFDPKFEISVELLDSLLLP